MNAKTILSMQLILLLCAVDASATIYDYSVDGQFEVDNVTQYVSGNMQISDEFLVDGEVRYYFGITGFSLNVAGGTSSFNFSGDSGSLLYIHQITDPQTGQKYYEQQWGISNTFSEVWVNPFSTSIYFYTSDMTPYLPTSSEYYGVLAPIIGLDRPFYASQYSDTHAPRGISRWANLADEIRSASHSGAFHHGFAWYWTDSPVYGLCQDEEKLTWR